MSNLKDFYFYEFLLPFFFIFGLIYYNKCLPSGTCLALYSSLMIVNLCIYDIKKHFWYPFVILCPTDGQVMKNFDFMNSSNGNLEKINYIDIKFNMKQRTNWNFAIRKICQIVCTKFQLNWEDQLKTWLKLNGIYLK